MTKPRRGSILMCHRCGAEFYRRPSGIEGARYCSRDCQFEAFKTGKPRKCQECGETYYVSPAQVKHRGSRFCSTKCQSAAKSRDQAGSKNQGWQGGKIKVTRLDTYFSLFIRVRDGFACQRCGHKFEDGAHGLDNSHFIGRANKRTRYDEENCDALCRGCHQVFETHKVTLYREWKIEQLGLERYDALIERSREPLRSGTAEWDAMTQRVRDRLLEINGRLDKRGIA